MSAVTMRGKDPITVLVTGGSGLVGKAVEWVVQNEADGPFSAHDHERWIFLSRKDGDLRVYGAAQTIFEKHRPKVVIHLAAKVGGVFANSACQADFLRDNLSIDQNVLSLSQSFGVEKLISCLSTCIFPDETSYPINESMIHNGPPHDSNFGYSYAKRILDISNRSQYGCKFTSIIPTNIYGPHDNFSDGCHFIPAIIKKVHDAKKTSPPILRIAGTGNAQRQFIYSRDVARVIVWAIHFYEEVDPFIVSVNEQDEISIKDAVGRICRLSGFEGKILWDPSQSDGQVRKTADDSKLRRLLPSFRTVPFAQGIYETLVWYEKHQRNLDSKL